MTSSSGAHGGRRWVPPAVQHRKAMGDHHRREMTKAIADVRSRRSSRLRDAADTAVVHPLGIPVPVPRRAKSAFPMWCLVVPMLATFIVLGYVVAIAFEVLVLDS